MYLHQPLYTSVLNKTFFPPSQVYQDSTLAYFIDASDPKYGNWMNFIQCARNQHEQNLKALQYNGCLYFEGVRDITVGEELLVWYDDIQYDIYMGIPVGYRGKSESGRFTCKCVCGWMFSYDMSRSEKLFGNVFVLNV